MNFQRAKRRQRATAPVWGEASTLSGPPDGAGIGWRVRLGQWLADPPFQAVSMTCTFYALFLPDVCTGFLAPGADTAIMSVGLAIVFFFFIAEGILMVTVRPSYMFTLFFALDVVATVSLVFDIPWIADIIFGGDSNDDDTGESLTLTRSARLARVGARIGRLGRLARLFRVFKLLKIMIVLQARRWAAAHNDEEDEEENEFDADDIPDFLKTSVQNKVSRRIVVLMLVTVTSVIALQFYVEDLSAATAFLVAAAASKTANTTQMQGQIAEIEKAVPNLYYFQGADCSAPPLIDRTKLAKYQQLRDSEIESFQLDGDCSHALLDISVDKEEKAALNILLIVMIMAILLVGSIRLSSDIVAMLLDPTQRLLRTKCTSDALLDVFKAISKKHGGLDTTVATVLQASRNLLSCKAVNIYFVDQHQGGLRLLQTSMGVEEQEQKQYGQDDGLTIDSDDTTILGAICHRAQDEVEKEEYSLDKVAANLYWETDSNKKGNTEGAVNLLEQTRVVHDEFLNSPDHPDAVVAKQKRGLSKTISTKMGLDSSKSAYITSSVWTDRWKKDPSMQQDSCLSLGTVHNQLCMSIIAEVGGKRRVVGLVQAINKQVRLSANRKRQMTCEQKSFRDYDVDSLQLFCQQIADLIEKKGKDAEFSKKMSADDSLGQLMRSYEGKSTFSNPQDASSTRSGQELWIQTRDTVKAASGFAEKTHASRHAFIPSKVPVRDLQQWGYGCLDLTHDELVGSTVAMFDSLDLPHAFGIPVITLQNYVDKVLSSYNKVPYHNAYHAFAVAQGCYHFITTCKGWDVLSKENQLWMLIAALGHDSGHDGVNTAFHVSMHSEIADLYNDMSPLEMMHARNTMNLMRDESCNLFAAMPQGLKLSGRASIVQMIIATDMKFHKAKVEKLQDHAEPFDLTKPDEAQTMMELALHAVDIGHPTFSWEQECRWARLVATEFQTQVDREGAAGLPESGFMKCTGEQNLAEGQVGFFKFMVLPLFQEFVRHMPEMEDKVLQLNENTENFAKCAKGQLQMVPVSARDNEIMSWSVGVASLALGKDHAAIVAAKPQTVLMATMSEARP